MKPFAGVMALSCVLAGCGFDVQAPDDFLVTRTGEGKTLTMVVNDSGTITCNGGPAKQISDPLLISARDLVTNLESDAKKHLHLAPAPGSVYSYTMRFEEGTISFADTSADHHKELAPAVLFALQAAQGPCGTGGG